MNIKLVFGLAALTVALVSVIPYLRDVLKGKTKPHMYSWLIWSILQTIGVITQIRGGGGYGALALGVGAAFCFLFFILSFKYGTKDITKFDEFCLAASLIIILFYLIIKDPVLTVIFVSIIDFVGFLPTFRKAYKDPEAETISTFALSSINNLLSLCALENYSFVTAFYLINAFFSNTFFVVMVMIRRSTVKNIISNRKLNILDEGGNIIGENTRYNIHKLGLLHREIHVWLYTKNGEIIFQHRSKNKDTCPDLLDATVGGHVEIGDDFEKTAIKEVEEETGIKIKNSDLILIKTIRDKKIDKATGMINNFIRAIYALPYKGNIEDLKIEQSETMGFETWSIDDLLNISEENKKRFTPFMFSEKTLSIFKNIEHLIKTNYENKKC